MTTDPAGRLATPNPCRWTVQGVCMTHDHMEIVCDEPVGREATVWIDTGGLALAVRLRLAWAVLRCRPVEMRQRSPHSDTVFPL